MGEGVTPMRVLVIEDSNPDFYLIERALGAQFILTQESTLAAGLATAVRERFDLVILDLSLDDSRGYETFEKAHAAVPNLPILILSGSEDEELALRAVSNGAQDFVRKSRLLDYPLDRTARYAVERRRAEQELRESERFARSTVNSLATEIAILDEAGVIQAVNTAWRRFEEENGACGEGYDVGTNYLQVCDHAAKTDEIAHAVSAGIRAIIRHEKNSFELEYPCHSPTAERWFIMRVTPFEGEGPTRVVVSHENITARKIAERLAREQYGLREAIAGMEQVLGVVGHELRTPLASIRVMSEYLCDEGARNTAEAENFLLGITEQVDRMADTIENLLEAARLNSGRARWNWTQVELLDVIEGATASIRPLVDPAKVQIDVHVGGSVSYMLGDADAIRRLLVNLLSNAHKHTSQGRIDITARQYTHEECAWIELIVKDTGSGIPPELSARLGEAFALNSGVVGSNYISGTGLGLSICKGIAAAHGGVILVNSTQGEGTAVTARLRADLEAAAQGDTVYACSLAGVAA